jgi:hypothetical protein
MPWLHRCFRAGEPANGREDSFEQSAKYEVLQVSVGNEGGFASGQRYHAVEPTRRFGEPAVISVRQLWT